MAATLTAAALVRGAPLCAPTTSHSAERARGAALRTRRARVACSASNDDCTSQLNLGRRDLLAATPLLAGAALLAPEPAEALPSTPFGFRYYVDELDGYSFYYPEDWTQVTTSGNDVCYRNPFQLEENLFVDVSSPSSSKYKSVTQVGTPFYVAGRIAKQYKREFMSTRLGVERTTEVIAANERDEDDGTYYDSLIRITSYASESQLAITPEQRQATYGVEWDRMFYTVMGTANGRLYSLRMQFRQQDLEEVFPKLKVVGDSFTTFYVEQK